MVNVLIRDFSCLSYVYLFFFFFFFFQAEDGIRDKLVTGVQTCDLPIWRSSAPPITRSRASTIRSGSRDRARRAWCTRRRSRSEERRVGKECRSRWAPYQ